MIRKILTAFLALTLVFAITACGEQSGGETPAPSGEMTVQAPSKKDNPAQNAVDGDRTTGWVGKKKASETNPQIFEIDFGQETTFSKITIDDSFGSGFTNKRPEFLQKKVSYNRGDASSTAEGSGLPFMLNGKADGKGWKGTEIPTEQAPQQVYFSIRKNCEITKLVLDNAIYNSVPQSFSVYYSSELLQDADLKDISKYTKLFETTENTENIVEIQLTEKVSVRSMMIEFRKQINEGKDSVPSLDEIFFYEPTDENYKEPHNPVRFQIMGSSDGVTYEVIVEEQGNYNEIWNAELENPVTYRYIKYLLFEELGNNYPSVGEFIFE